MSSAVQSYELASEAGEESSSACLAEAVPDAREGRAPRKGTVAISAALLVTLTFVGLALLMEPPRDPAADALQLRASLLDFSCATEACTRERR